jgi:hypothetical protein
MKRSRVVVGAVFTALLGAAGSAGGCNSHLPALLDVEAGSPDAAEQGGEAAADASSGDASADATTDATANDGSADASSDAPSGDVLTDAPTGDSSPIDAGTDVYVDATERLDALPDVPVDVASQ